MGARPTMKVWSIDHSRVFGRSSYPVFVLGAGASKDIGLPVCTDFFDSNYINSIRRWIDHDDLDFFQTYKNRGLGLEEILISLMENGDTEETSRCLRYYQNILKAAETQAGGCDEPHDKTKKDDEQPYLVRMRYYIDLIFHIAMLHFRANQYPVVITFNHDMWIEYVSELQSNGKSTWYGGFNYGRITNRMFNDCLHPPLPSFGHDFTVLKLHGSFGWMLCDKCKWIWCGCDMLWDYAGARCGRCGAGNMKPLYVPPYRNKSYEPFAESWEDAAYFLNRAHAVYIFGYSLPAYDFESKKLITLYTNRDASLYIVDKYASAMVGNYSRVRVAGKYVRSCGLRDFIETGMMEDLLWRERSARRRFLALP